MKLQFNTNLEDQKHVVGETTEYFCVNTKVAQCCVGIGEIVSV